jgi:hypothetical protein
VCSFGAVAFRFLRWTGQRVRFAPTQALDLRQVTMPMTSSATTGHDLIKWIPMAVAT